MSNPPIIDDDYESEADFDFAPDTAAAGAVSESESDADDDEPQAARAETKRKPADPDAIEGDFENSGDEAVIHKGNKRRKKTKRADGANDHDEETEDGFVKTRSQRAQEKAERKSHATSGPVTIDVDDLWARMTTAPLLPPKSDETPKSEGQQPLEAEIKTNAVRDQARTEKAEAADSSDLIKIKRKYNFAGKVHTEEKLVPRQSAEAKLYLASKDAAVDSAEPGNEDDEQPKRKPRKAFRSVFEPIVDGLAQRADLNLGMSVRLQLREEQQQQAKAKKLNVVEKSRMDWAGFVDKEGIKDDLELAGKSKESYTHRQDFLLRVEAKKEEEARRARIAGRG